jgi:hypothetical protein
MMAAPRVGAHRCTPRQRALVELDELKSTFMHNLSHELSTPLTPLAGYLRILSSDKLGPMSPQQKRVVDSMIQSVTRLSRVVDNLSDFASLQAGESQILEGPVNPDQLADDVVAELRPMIKDARLNVTVAHAGGGPVVADPRKLRQAVANIVSNAVKFSSHGGEVLVEVSRQPGKLRYTIYDQGPGIQSGEQDRIFEPLHHARARGSRTRARRARGSGCRSRGASPRRTAEASGWRAPAHAAELARPPVHRLQVRARDPAPPSGPARGREGLLLRLARLIRGRRAGTPLPDLPRCASSSPSPAESTPPLPPRSSSPRGTR